MTQVLIAEDEDDIRQVLVFALSDAGSEVVKAKTEALAASISLNFARTRHPGLPVTFRDENHSLDTFWRLAPLRLPRRVDIGPAFAGLR